MESGYLRNEDAKFLQFLQFICVYGQRELRYSIGKWEREDCVSVVNSKESTRKQETYVVGTHRTEGCTPSSISSDFHSSSQERERHRRHNLGWRRGLKYTHRRDGP